MSVINIARHRAVICIAAGEFQLPVIRAARSAGYSVVAIDRNSDAPGFAEADVALVRSTYESAPIIDELKRLSSRFQWFGVINRSSGPPVVTAAEITQFLGLPGMAPEAARIAIDKGRLMAFCADQGLKAPHAVTWCVGDDLPRNLSAPAVVKPALSLVGKKGVRRINKISDFPEALAEAASFAWSGQVNIEQVIEGNDVVLLGLVLDGKIRVLALLDEHNTFDAKGRAKGVAFAVPSCFEGTSAGHAVVRSAEALVSALKLTCCPLGLAFRIDSNHVPHLIEAHLDMSGDRVLDSLLPSAAPGFDAFDWFVRGLCGEFYSVGVLFNPTAVVFGNDDCPASKRKYDVWTEESITKLRKRIENRKLRSK